MGSLALILHSHLPFVRHPEQEHFLEEEWLFEAITESYIPLLQVMQRLVRDRVAFRLTMSLTPTLAAMLNDELLRVRYIKHLDLLIELMVRECARNREDSQLLELAQFYHHLFSETRHFFIDECGCDLIGAFRALRQNGSLEIIASAATHAVLPLHSIESQRAQVFTGRDIYFELFGQDPSGFWLPECAYAPGLEKVLQEANIRWFVIDAHGLLHGNPQPRRAIYAPVFTPAGPAAFARDRDSSRQVWSAETGYPGDPTYREFYRDIGFDLPLEHLGPVARGLRKFSGVKYHRITGRGAKKELYDREAAKNAADRHAAHLLGQQQAQIRQLSALDPNPIVVIPFDAELFGHWWFEGPHFLEMFIRKAVFDQNDFQLTTPSEYLARYPTQQKVEPAASSWGEGGYLGVWLDPTNAWIYPHLHNAEKQMTEFARQSATQTNDSDPKNMTAASSHVPEPFAERNLRDKVLKQLARELLLGQASDWAFLMKTGTAKEYAVKRTQDHLVRFNRLCQQYRAGNVDDRFLRECEWRDNIFPNVNWRYYI